MKVALVHDWLNTKLGGGESVLIELAAIYPDAPIYTLLYNQAIIGDAIEPSRVRPSMLQRLPGFIRKHPRYLLPLLPTAIEQFDFSAYDVIISSSSAFAKGIITRPETLHICYCHSPMRFVWDYWPRYLAELKVGPLRQAAIRRSTSRIRLWDFYSAARVDKWIANSETTANRIRKYYRTEPDAVIFPGANLATLKPSPKTSNYMVTLSSLTPYKKIDLAIAACNQTSTKLIVIGDGPDRSRLEHLAGPTIQFVGRVNDDERNRLLAEASALIFPNEEDFGIAPIEAMACGTPVIAYAKGGLTETLKEGESGVFFNEPTPESLANALRSFKPSDFSTDVLVRQAKHFNRTAFREAMQRFVEKSYREHAHNASHPL